ncbi:hypothetical protein GGG16DRAFT_98843 [Schizophyllum commune]
MCNFYVLATSPNNKCGNRNVLIGDYEDPRRLYHLWYKADAKGRAVDRCHVRECRHQPDHFDVVDHRPGETCNQKGCVEGPFVSRMITLPADPKDPQKNCGLRSCSRCKGGNEEQQYEVFSGRLEDYIPKDLCNERTRSGQRGQIAHPDSKWYW